MITKGTTLLLLVLAACYDWCYSTSYIDRAFQALQDDFEQIRSMALLEPNNRASKSTPVQRSVAEDQKPTARTDNGPNYFIPEIIFRSGGGSGNFFPTNNAGSFRHNAPARATIQLRNVPERSGGFIQRDNNAIRIIPLDSRGRSLEENAVYGFMEPNRQYNYTQSSPPPPRNEGGRPYIIQHHSLPPHVTPFGNNGPTGFMNPSFMQNSNEYRSQGQMNQASRPEYNREMTNTNDNRDPNEEEQGYIFVSPSSTTTEMRPETESQIPENDDNEQVNVAEIMIPVPVLQQNQTPQENSDRANENVEMPYEILPIPQPRPRPSPNATNVDSPIGYIRFPPPPSLNIVGNRIRSYGHQNFVADNLKQKDNYGYASQGQNPYPIVPNPFLDPQNDSSNSNGYPRPFVPWSQNNNPNDNSNGTNPYVPWYHNNNPPYNYNGTNSFVPWFPNNSPPYNGNGTNPFVPWYQNNNPPYNSNGTNPFVPWYQTKNTHFNLNGTNQFVPLYPFSKNNTLPGGWFNNFLPFPFNKTSNSTGFELPIYAPPPNFFNPFPNRNDTPWNANNFSVFLKPPPGFFDNPLHNNSDQPNYEFNPFTSNANSSYGPEFSEQNNPQPSYPGSKSYDHGQPFYPNQEGVSENITLPGKSSGYDYEYPIPSPPLKNSSYSYDQESYHRLPPEVPGPAISAGFIPAVPDYRPYDFEKERSPNNSELERETERQPQNREQEDDYRPLASTIASQNSPDKDFSLNFDRPHCAKEADANFCITDPEYPRKLIEKAMLENESMAKLLYKDISIKDYYAATVVPPTDDFLDNQQQGGVLNPSLDAELNRKSIRKDEEENSQYRCSSVVHYAKPTRARNIHGEWKVIVNLDKNMEQITRLEVCTNVKSECIYTGKKVDSKCFQKQDKYKLLAFNEARGLHTDMFYLPVACSCFVGNTLT